MTDEQREALHGITDEDLISEFQGRFEHTLMVMLKDSDAMPGRQESLLRYSGGIFTAMGLVSAAEGELSMACFGETDNDEEAPQ